MSSSVAEALVQVMPGAVQGIAMMAGLVIVAPAMSHSGVNQSAKSALCLVLGVIIGLPMNSGDAPAADLLHLAARCLTGLGIGFYVGFVYLMAFEAIKFCGTIIGYSSQLGFAMMVDASTGVQNNVIERLIYHFALMLFLAMGGIEMMILSLSWAPGHVALTPDYAAHLVYWSGRVFLFGLFMALPIVITAYIINLGMAVVTKSAPSMNVFSIGFPIVILTTMVLLYLYTPHLMSSFTYYYIESIETAL